MPICKCSDSCEHYVSASSKTGLHRNCQARIKRWDDIAEAGETWRVLEYARKLDVRRGTLGYVVSKTEVVKAAIAKRKEAASEERKVLRQRARERRQKAKQEKRKLDARKAKGSRRQSKGTRGGQESRAQAW